MANIRFDLISFTNRNPFSIMNCMGFYVNNLDDFLGLPTPIVHGVCLYCKTKPITGNRRKFCSIECTHAYHQPPKKTRVNKELKCNWCKKTFVSKKGAPHYYCSKDCYNQEQYEKNRGFSRKDVSRVVESHVDVDLSSDSYRFNGWLAGRITLPDKVMSVLQALPNDPFIYEDMVEINKIIIEEVPPATYVNGTPYVKSKKYSHKNWGKWRKKKH
jgi:bifunctional DNA-binding transcriptional regulator/antitoxin component of YhaV-PrlF toxin-antitoxin module